MNTGTYRPKLRIPLTSIEIGLEAISLIGLFVGIAVLALNWTSLPERVPTHFGITGLPDASGPKATLLFLPVLSIVLYLVLTILSRFPHIYNYPVQITEENAERQYRLSRTLIHWLKAELIWLLVYMEWMMVRVALYQAPGLGMYSMPIIVAIMVATTVLYFRMSLRAR